MDKQQLLPQLVDIFARWQSLLAPLSEAQIIAADPSGYSIKDTIAHLHGWQQLSIARLDAARRGEEPVMPAWVMGLDPDDEALTEVFNGQIQETARHLSWSHVHEQWRNGFERFLELAQSIPASDLQARGQYPWLGEYALGDVLLGWLEHHAEHLHDLTGATSCLTCELLARRDRGEAPLWDNIHCTDHWDVVHSYNTSLPGWLVLVVRRHVAAIDELTEEEAAELGLLLRRTSVALRRVVGCAKTYVIQFAEAAEHPHVHFHVVPRAADMPPERRSLGVFGYLGVPEAERVSEAELNEIARRVRRVLLEPR